MKEYNARLVAKLEKKNLELQVQTDALRKHEQQLLLQATALEAAANAIIITDNQGAILSVDPAFTVLTGYSAAEALGQNPRMLKSDVAYLSGEGKYSNRSEYPLPDLMLLDLKMPRMNGFEVLEWIRRQPGLSSLRVVVLTASDNMRDVNSAYKLGANSFMVKPMDLEDVVHMGKFLTTYWLRLSKAPETSRPQRWEFHTTRVLKPRRLGRTLKPHPSRVAF